MILNVVTDSFFPITSIYKQYKNERELSDTVWRSR